MQVIKIIKNTAKSRVFFYDKNDSLLFSADATTAFSANHTNNSVSINFDAEGSFPISFGWASDLIYLGVDATPPVLQSGTFSDFLNALKDTYFSQSASGGSGGGGGGDATAAKQDDQIVLLTAANTATGTPTDSPTTNPFGSSTQTALQKGIFANGLHGKVFEQVIDPLTGIEYWRFIDFDPTTPPTAAVYIDPPTGLVTTAPANPVYPVNRNLILEGAIGNKTDTAVTNPAQDASVIAVLKGISLNTAPPPTPSNHFRNSGTTNSVLVKSGAGKILSGTFTNRTTGTKYLRIYSFNSTPAPTLTPLMEITAITGATVQIPQINGFVLGIAYIISSSANQAGAQLTVADAASVQLSYI